MSEEERREKLDRLYAELEKYKGKKDQYSVKERQRIRLKIKDTKNIMTHEDWQHLLEERSEIDVSRC